MSGWHGGCNEDASESFGVDMTAESGLSGCNTMLSDDLDLIRITENHFGK